jgi:DNA relaxase NicK
LVRDCYPVHRVTRLDAAQDYDGPGTWDKLHQVAVKHADAGGLKLHQAGDWHRLKDGRSIYLGSRKSSVFVRFYEKGKQLGADLVGTGTVDVRTDWCRAELVLRPANDARSVAALSSPEEAWGFSRWTRNLLKALDNTEVERVNMNRHRIPDHEASFLHMVNQYESVLALINQDMGGSWAEVGEKIGELVRRKQSQRQNMRQSEFA